MATAAERDAAEDKADKAAHDKAAADKAAQDKDKAETAATVKLDPISKEIRTAATVYKLGHEIAGLLRNIVQSTNSRFTLLDLAALNAAHLLRDIAYRYTNDPTTRDALVANLEQIAKHLETFGGDPNVPATQLPSLPTPSPLVMAAVARDVAAREAAERAKLPRA